MLPLHSLSEAFPELTMTSFINQNNPLAILPLDVLKIIKQSLPLKDTIALRHTCTRFLKHKLEFFTKMQETQKDLQKIERIIPLKIAIIIEKTRLNAVFSYAKQERIASLEEEVKELESEAKFGSHSSTYYGKCIIKLEAKKDLYSDVEYSVEVINIMLGKNVADLPIFHSVIDIFTMDDNKIKSLESPIMKGVGPSGNPIIVVRIVNRNTNTVGIFMIENQATNPSHWKMTAAGEYVTSTSHSFVFDKSIYFFSLRLLAHVAEGLNANFVIA